MFYRLAVLLVLAPWIPLHAQAPHDSQTVRLRVNTAAGQRRIVGQLQTVTADSLTILTGDSLERRSFHRLSVAEFERWAGMKRNTGRGAGIGFGVGLGIGLASAIVAVAASGDRNCDGGGFLEFDFSAACAPGLWIAGGAVGGGVVGAVLGTAIGTTQKTDRWRREPVPPAWKPQIVLGPRRVALRLALPRIR